MKILSAVDPSIAEIVAILKPARDHYYNTHKNLVVPRADVPAWMLPLFRRYTAKGVVNDALYDALEAELIRLSPNHPLLKAVGVAPKKSKIRLPFRMPSLDKIRGDSADRWLEANEGPYVVSDKIDGVSLGIRYKSGELLLFTRGDGTSGGDITFMAQELGLPQLKRDMMVRGEVVMPVATFQRLWREHFANPRNMVSGITNRNSLHEALAHCKVYAYELVMPRMRPSAGLAQLKRLGFRVVPYKIFDKLDQNTLKKLLAKRRTSARYEMDGLVVSQDTVHAQATSNPTWSMAFKDVEADDSAVTRVVEVVWRTTRTGALFPRVMIEPVKLKGVTVTWCTGKSGMTIKNLGIGPGAKVRIARSNDVIPELREVIRAARPQLPSRSEFGRWSWKGDNIVLDDYTSNEGTANDVAVQTMSHFFTTIGIERFKEATLQRFADAGINTVAAVLCMTEQQFLAVPGTSPKVLQSVWRQLQTAITGVELHVLMYASGVFGRNFGTRRFAAIIRAIPDIMRWSGNRSALVHAIDDVEGFDLTTAQQFANQFKAFQSWLQTVPRVTYTGLKTVRKTGNRCAGQRVLMTGFRDQELSHEIVSQGGDMATSVKKATVLLVSDPNSTSEKANDARLYGIPIMTADQFRKRYLK